MALKNPVQCTTLVMGCDAVPHRLSIQPLPQCQTNEAYLLAFEVVLLRRHYEISLFLLFGAEEEHHHTASEFDFTLVNGSLCVPSPTKYREPPFIYRQFERKVAFCDR